MRHDDDYEFRSESDRERYLSDLERVRRIRDAKEDGGNVRPGKTISDYIDDYYYNTENLDDDYEDYHPRRSASERRSMRRDSDRADRRYYAYDDDDAYDDFFEEYSVRRRGSSSEIPIDDPAFDRALERDRLEAYRKRRNQRKSEQIGDTRIYIEDYDEFSERERYLRYIENKRKAKRSRSMYDEDFQDRPSRRNTPSIQPGLKLTDVSKHPSERIPKNTENQRSAGRRQTDSLDHDEPLKLADVSHRSVLQRDEPEYSQRNEERKAAKAARESRTKTMPASRRGMNTAQKQAQKTSPRTNSVDHLGAEFANDVRKVRQQNQSMANSGKSGKQKVKKAKIKQKPANNQPKKSIVKRLFSGTIKVLLILLLIGGGFLAYSFYTKQEGYYTIAVFGVDSRDGNIGKGALADVNMICNINRGTGAVQLISVYRDTYTEIDGKGTYHKLNEAYFKGGPTQAVGALERNLDLDIEGYATFNWKAVIDAINILGGIDLEITEPEFKYINSFITETVESTGVGSVQLEHAGMNHLDGVQAVAYARLRLMDTDFNRTERQRKVVRLAFEKAKKADFKTLNQLVLTILPQTSTNLAIDDVLPFAKNVKQFYLAESSGFPFDLTAVNIKKKDCVVPVTLKSNVIKLHSFLYGDQPYTPSQRMKEISAQIIADSGKGKDDDADIQIKLDKNDSGGIGNQPAESDAPKKDKTTKETQVQEQKETENQTPEETTQETRQTGETEETTTAKESKAESIPATEAPTQAFTIAPATQEAPTEAPTSPPDAGDAGINEQPTIGPNPGGLDDDANNGPGVY